MLHRSQHMYPATNGPQGPAVGRPFRDTRATVLRAPIVILELYLASTVAVFFFGAIDWLVPSVPKLLLFLLVNYGGIWIGYRWGIRGETARWAQRPMSPVAPIRIPQQVMWLALWCMAFSIFSNLVRLEAIRGLDTVFSALVNPGRAYNEAQAIAQLDRDGSIAGTAIASYSWVFQTTTLFAAFQSLSFPLGLACWRQMTIPYKFAFVASVLSSLLYAFGIGAQSGIGFLLFSGLPVALYIHYVIPGPTGIPSMAAMPLTRGSVWSRAKMKLLVAVSTCALVAIVATFQLDRHEDSGRRLDPAAALAGRHGTMSQNWVLQAMDERVSFALVMMSLYPSHGYEGLALAMDLPFEWTYGLGWSKALQVIVHDYLGGPDMFEKTYLARNEASNGWPALSWWSTIFPWLASDTTFYGTVWVMILIGFVTARCWVDAIATGNPLSLAVLAQVFTLVFMFPANNALFQTLDGLFSFVGVTFLYGVSRNSFRSARTAYRVTRRAALPTAPTFESRV